MQGENTNYLREPDKERAAQPLYLASAALFFVALALKLGENFRGDQTARREYAERAALGYETLNAPAASQLADDSTKAVVPVTTNSLIIEEGSKVREFLRKALLDAYRDEYKELAATWRTLETKAQGNIAIAGIFIAGIFVFLRDGVENFTTLEKSLLAGGASLFVSSIVSAVFVLMVTETRFPSMKNGERMFIDVLGIQEEARLLEYMPGFVNEQANFWLKTRNGINRVIRKKARYLVAAQALLLIGIVPIAVLVLIKITIF